MADVSLVKAWKGDTEGNLVYRKTARNFNPNMATAARVTVAEVEELVETGDARSGSHPYPGHFRAAHHPGRALHQGDREAHGAQARGEAECRGRVSKWPRARRGSSQDGFYVNLGIGIPDLGGELHSRRA